MANVLSFNITPVSKLSLSKDFNMVNSYSVSKLLEI
jgi:hypothetical protein